MKILDRYIFYRFLQTFLVVFFIVMFIMILQMIWLYIAELAGKDLEVSVIFKFIIYASPTLIPLTLPLSILISSIMVFGELSEHYELAAIKSTGISLQRSLRPATIFIIFLSIGTFFFANNIIPASQREFIGLRRNIVRLKPAAAIVANQFNEIGGINIKVASKYGNNDQFLDDVIIHKQKGKIKGNFTVIKSKTGELVSGIDSDVLSLILRDGYYYDEMTSKKIKQKKKYPFVKSKFKEYAINLDLSSFNDVDLSKKEYIKNRKMLNVNLLKKDIDSFSIKINEKKIDFAKQNVKKIRLSPISNRIELDCEVYEYPSSIEQILDYENQRLIINRAKKSITDNLSKIKREEKSLRKLKENNNKFEIALHEKFALAFACIVLFFIGAPLGSIIRKGGLGLPLLYAMGIFLAYHFIGIFAKNSAENGTISPFLASWLSTFLIFTLGILLTYRATTEKNLITMDFDFNKFFTKLFQNSSVNIHPKFVKEINTLTFNLKKAEFDRLNKLSNKKLLAIVNESCKIEDIKFLKASLFILNTRGVVVDEFNKLYIAKNNILKEVIQKWNREEIFLNDLEIKNNKWKQEFIIGEGKRQRVELRDISYNYIELEKKYGSDKIKTTIHINMELVKLKMHFSVKKKTYIYISPQNKDDVFLDLDFLNDN